MITLKRFDYLSQKLPLNIEKAPIEINFQLQMMLIKDPSIRKSSSELSNEFNLKNYVSLV